MMLITAPRYFLGVRLTFKYNKNPQTQNRNKIFSPLLDTSDSTATVVGGWGHKTAPLSWTSTYLFAFQVTVRCLGVTRPRFPASDLCQIFRSTE